MTNIDLLSVEEQHVFLWAAEAELGVAEPLAVSIANVPSERVDMALDRLVRLGLLTRELTWLNRDHSSPVGLPAVLTGQGAEVVVGLWRRRLRELPEARLTA